MREHRVTYDRRTSTRAIVHMHNDDFPNGGAPITFSVSPNDFGSLIAVQTGKRFGQPSGTFSFTIKKNARSPQGSLLRHWKDPEDTWIEIIFLTDGQPFYTMLGLVDSVKETTARSTDGSRSETYTVIGRDVGKVFEATQLFVNIFEESGGAAQYTAIYDAQQGRVSGTPEDFIRTLVDIWLANQKTRSQPWQLPKSLGGGSFFSLLNMDRIQSMDVENGIHFDPSLLRPSIEGTPLWAMMVQYSNPVLNELWIDVQSEPPSGDGGIGGLASAATSAVSGKAERFKKLHPAVFLRERPFPTTKDGHRRWDSIPTHNLQLRDVNPRRQITKGSAASRFNYWMLDLTSFQNLPWGSQAFLQSGQIDGARDNKPGDIPIINKRSIEKHGLRIWRQDTKFINFLEHDTDDPVPIGPSTQTVADLAANWLRKLHDWYIVAPMELTGTLGTTRLFPEIHIGERVKEVRMDEPPIIYYVEGVEHEWQYPGAGSTRLTVTRGEYEGENLLKAAYKDYEQGVGLGGIDAANAVDQIQRAVNFGSVNLSEHGADVGELGAFDAQDLLSGVAGVMDGQKTDSYPATTAETVQARRLAMGDPTAKVIPIASPVGEMIDELGFDDDLREFLTDQESEELT